MKQFNAAIVGLGNIAWKFDYRLDGKLNEPLTHAGTYQLNPRTQLTGGCSPDVKDRKNFEQHYNLPTFDSIQDLINATNPGIVSICSPTEFHFEHVMECLEAKVPMIWLEKPPTLTIEQLDQLIDKQKSLDTSHILVNYHRRYAQPYIRLRDVIQEDVLGKAVYANINYSRGLVPNGSHLIDTLFFVLGDDLEASLEFTIFSSGTDSPSFVLSLSNGLTTLVSGMSLSYHCVDISITCENGRASVLYGGMETRWELKVEHELFPGFYRLKESADNPIGAGGYKGIMMAALDDLINSFESGREPVSNLLTARKTQALLNDVYKMRSCSE